MARRRDCGKFNDTPARGVAKPIAKKRSSSSSKRGGSIKKIAKLVLLVGAMLCIGFFAVLLVDVAGSIVGHVKLGDITVVDVLHKMVDRVLDRDVPRTSEPSRAAPAPAKPHAGTSSSAPSSSSASSAASESSAARAPLPAANPEDDARHVEHVVEARPDPEVQQAKERLDELFRRIR